MAGSPPHFAPRRWIGGAVYLAYNVNRNSHLRKGR
jgi:hypothetical protein